MLSSVIKQILHNCNSRVKHTWVSFLTSVILDTKSLINLPDFSEQYVTPEWYTKWENKTFGLEKPDKHSYFRIKLLVGICDWVLELFENSSKYRKLSIKPDEFFWFILSVKRILSLTAGVKPRLQSQSLLIHPSAPALLKRGRKDITISFRFSYYFAN